MAGDLILISKATASDSTSISLTGMSSTYDFYVAKISGVTHSTTAYDYVRFTVGGSVDTSANYDSTIRTLRTAAGDGSNSYANQTFIYTVPYEKDTGAGSSTNATIHIFDSQLSTEYTYCTVMESSSYGTVGGGNSGQGAGILKEDQVTDGINFSPSAGNYPKGEFRLYGYNKT